MAQWYSKRPGNAATYAQDWSDWLGADTIESAAWDVPDGLTGSQATFTDTTTSIKLSGGTSGVDYEVVCTITTAAGDVWSRSAWVAVSPW